jgi:hypothetical protein
MGLQGHPIVSSWAATVAPPPAGANVDGYGGRCGSACEMLNPLDVRTCWPSLKRPDISLHYPRPPPSSRELHVRYNMATC